MVRLVFRPYAQVRRSICTSEPLRSSTRVSSGFNLLKHSSPSFGSQRARFRSIQPMRRNESADDAPTFSEKGRISSLLPSLCSRVSYCPAPRARVRLLGPCFKTGRRGGRLKPQTPDVQRARHATRRPSSNLPLRAVASTDDQRATADRLSRADMESLLGPSAGSEPRAYNTPSKQSYLAPGLRPPTSRSRPSPNASAAAPARRCKVTTQV